VERYLRATEEIDVDNDEEEEVDEEDVLYMRQVSQRRRQ
jgi:hypothetical protein